MGVFAFYMFVLDRENIEWLRDMVRQKNIWTSPAVTDMDVWLPISRNHELTYSYIDVPTNYTHSIVVFRLFHIINTLWPRQNGRHLADGIFERASPMKMFEFRLIFH